MSGETPVAKTDKPSEAAPTNSGALSGRPAALIRVTATLVVIISVSLSLYQLYTAGIAALTALIQRSIHLGAILSLTFLLKPPFKRASKDRLTVWFFIDWILVLLSVVCVIYICINLNAHFSA